MFNISKITNFPYYIFTLPLLVDTLNGVARGASGEEESLIGIIYKGMIILYSIIYTKALNNNYVLLLIFISLCCFIFQLILGVFCIAEVVSLTKCFYCFFVLVILLNSPYCSNEQSVVKAAVLYGFGASLILILSYVFGWGYASYQQESSFGVKGFFIGMNDVCLSILLINCLSILYYQKTKEVFFLLSSVLMCIGNVLVASMAGIFGTAIIIMVYTISVFIIPFKNYKSHKKEKLFLVIVLLGSLIYVISFIIESIMADAYLASKYDDIYTTFTEVSGRGILIEAAEKVIRERSLIFDLCGQGNKYLYDVNNALGWSKGMKAAEVDVYDLIGSYGILLTVLIMFYPVKMFFVSSYAFVRNMSIDYYWVASASLIFIGHSIYGGHAFTSPISYSYLMPFVYIMVNRKRLRFK